MIRTVCRQDSFNVFALFLVVVVVLRKIKYRLKEPLYRLHALILPVSFLCVRSAVYPRYFATMLDKQLARLSTLRPSEIESMTSRRHADDVSAPTALSAVF